jgi:hypothetical protein
MLYLIFQHGDGFSLGRLTFTSSILSYTISLTIEEAYRRNKIDVNKYINTDGYGFDLS